jgi:nucleotide-binding universal stress UspA family protein
MNNFLIPTDFSDNSLKALDYGARIAVQCGATLHLVHAFILLDNVFFETKSFRDAYNKNQADEYSAALFRIQNEYQEKYPGLSMEVHLFSGPSQQVLLQYTTDKNIDLVIMGTKGATGLAEVVVGSNTALMIELSKVPVLAIPEICDTDKPEGVVLATKFFERDKTLLNPVFELAEIFKIPIHVFVYESDSDSDADIEDTDIKLRQYNTYLQSCYPAATLMASHREGEDFELAIADFCEENNIGIICMLTKKRSFLEQLFNPSLTKKMAYHSTIPLLAIPC